MKSNKVFIATSLDGYIADKDGGISWLDTFPEINSVDTGYKNFMAGIDALLMGRHTYETVCGFDVPWPYTKPVFVLSSSLNEIPKEQEGKVFLEQGPLNEVLQRVHQKGHHQLYIDGGSLIQSFLKQDLIDEMVITTIPVLLGQGVPLFGEVSEQLKFRCTETKLFFETVVQNRYLRLRTV